MDRKAWLAVSLSIIGLILWYVYYLPSVQPTGAPAAQPTASATPQATPQQIVEPVATPQPTPQGPVIAARSETLSAGEDGNRAEFVFNNDTGGIQSAILLMHLGENEAVHLNRDAATPIGALAFDPATPLGGFEMTADREAGTVVFTRRDPDGLEIRKVFTLPGPDVKASPYVVNLEVSFHNTSGIPISRPAWFVSAGSAAPIHEKDLPTYTRFDWQREGKMKGIDTNWFKAGSILGFQTRPARPVFTDTDGPFQWVAVASQYFCTVLTPLDAQGTSLWSSGFDVPPKSGARPVYGIRGSLGMPAFTLDAGASLEQKFQIYSGPKEQARLVSLGHGEQQVLNFGWFGFVSKFLLWAMNKLHGLVGSYAAAIILLTLLIKGALWPIQNRATNSMRRMAALSPKMTELREKYKDDPTKMNQELMKLYRDYGINPFSGCLPMLIQIPIFFGFYAMLGTAIELRNSSFLWIHDLSQPDTIGHILGFPINVLPLVMAGTMLWQMAITPKTGDPAQQRILMFMPIIFVVVAYNYASALSLYWTTQNLFSIVQLYLTRNKPLPTLEKMKPVTKPTAGAGRKRKGRKS